MGSLQTIKVSYKMCTEVGRNDLSGASTELAYKFFLALFPFLIFLAALGGFISKAFGIVNPTDEVMNLIGKHLPNDASSLLRSQVDQVVRTRNSTLASLGILGAVMAASSGVASIMKAMNRVYDVKETRSMAKRYGLAVGLTLLGGAFVICAFILLVAGQLFGSEIADKLNLDSQTELIVSVARWPVAIFLLLIAIAFLFWAAPDIDLPFRWISPGAVLFVAIWLPATFLFGLYVAHFGSYDDTYGALGGVVVLLVWLYLSSFILLAAAELNSVLAQEGPARELIARRRKGAALLSTTGGKASQAQPPKVRRAEETEEDVYRFLAAAFLALVAVWTTAVKPRLSR